MQVPTHVRTAWDAASYIARSAIRHRLSGHAAEISFFALLSLIPVTVAIGAALKLVSATMGPDIADQGREGAIDTIRLLIGPTLADSVVGPFVRAQLTQQDSGVADRRPDRRLVAVRAAVHVGAARPGQGLRRIRPAIQPAQPDDRAGLLGRRTGSDRRHALAHGAGLARQQARHRQVACQRPDSGGHLEHRALADSRADPRRIARRRLSLQPECPAPVARLSARRGSWGAAVGRCSGTLPGLSDVRLRRSDGRTKQRLPGCVDRPRRRRIDRNRGVHLLLDHRHPARGRGQRPHHPVPKVDGSGR